MASKKPHKCEWCGAEMTKAEAKLNDICTECVQGAADDADRDMLGDDFDYFKNTGYLDNHTFGDK